MRYEFARLLSLGFYHRPIFQIGASRSGTIVLYKALGRHPKIFSMPSENPFVTYIASAVKPFEFGEEPKYFLRSVKIEKPYLYAQLRRLLFESAAGPHGGFKTLAKALIRERPPLLGKRMWCVKCFPLASDALALQVLYPSAKFIYIVRNGIDVVQSRRKFPAFRDGSFESHCEFWRHSAEKFSYLLDANYAVSVRQEDLLHDPDAVFRRIFAYLGIDNHPNSLDYVANTLVHSREDETTHENIDVKERLTAREPSYSSWTKAQIETFKAICSDEMQKLGYDIPF